MDGDIVTLAHGSGGRLSRDLIEAEILPRFASPLLRPLPDSALLEGCPARMLFTTDSFTVQPLEFPGGNIGDLAVCGTVNDLSVGGGRPRWLSLALIIEEGFPLARLRAILDAVRRRAEECGVAVVTGDTKVVGRGQCDGIYLNTAGLGEALPGFRLDPAGLREGDAVLVSGPVADHGTAVLLARHLLRIDNGPVSDVGPVHRLVAALAPDAARIRFMRDPTRGGLAGVLNEAAAAASCCIEIEESAIPVRPATRAVLETLGVDPLYVACEGRAVAVVEPAAADAALRAWAGLPEGAAACRIGTVRAAPPAGVVMRTLAGGRRLVDVPRGELLPRIC